MSEPLDRAVDARLDAYRPDSVPPFAAIEARKRRRDRRRLAGTGALSILAVAGAALLVPSLSGGGDRLTPDGDAQVYGGPGTAEASCAYTDIPGTSCAGDAGPQQYSVTFTGPSSFRGEADHDLVTACMEVPGTSGELISYSLPPQYSVTVTGAKAVEAFTACIGRIDNVTLSAVGVSRPATPEAAFPLTGAQVCTVGATEQKQECRRVDAETARALDTLLLAAEPAPPGTAYCDALSSVYRILFNGPGVKPVPIEVPDRCGPMKRGTKDYLLDQESRDKVRGAFNAGSPEPQGTPYQFTDCRGLRPGDTFNFQNLHCDGGDDIRVETMDCVENRVYVYLARDGRDDLEGMTGVTRRWLQAEPRDPSTGRTPFAFQNCKEHG